MTNIGLFKKEQKPQRETFNFITRVDTVDPELKKKTLERMLKLKKEQERKAAAKRKAVRRGFAVAAIVALVIAVTPLRGYVASAAEDAYEAFHSWMEDVFHVGMKKTDNGCTIEIIEARVVNDFLYLTVDEDVEELLEENPDKDYDNIWTIYSGIIKDDYGNILNFSTEDSIRVQDVDVIMSGHYTAYQYKIFLPNMKDVINSYDKKYTCEISADIIESNKVLTTFDFKFKIKNVSSVIEAKEYPSKASYTFGDFDFKFEKLVVAPSEMYMLVEIIPNNENLINKLQMFSITVSGFNNGKKLHITTDTNEEIPFDFHSGAIYKHNDKFYTTLDLFDVYFGKSEIEKILASEKITMPTEYRITSFYYYTEDKSDSEKYKAISSYADVKYEKLSRLEGEINTNNSVDINEIVTVGEHSAELSKIHLIDNYGIQLDFNLIDNENEKNIQNYWASNILSLNLIAVDENGNKHLFKISDLGIHDTDGEMSGYKTGDDCDFTYILRDSNTKAYSEILKNWNTVKITIASIDYETFPEESQYYSTVFHRISDEEYGGILKKTDIIVLSEIESIIFL